MSTQLSHLCRALEHPHLPQTPEVEEAVVGQYALWLLIVAQPHSMGYVGEDLIQGVIGMYTRWMHAKQRPEDLDWARMAGILEERLAATRQVEEMTAFRIALILARMQCDNMPLESWNIGLAAAIAETIHPMAALRKELVDTLKRHGCTQQSLCTLELDF